MWVIGTVLAAVVLWGGFACLIVGVLSGSGGMSGWGGDAVGVIYVVGPIGMSSAGGAAGVDSETILRFIRQAEANSSVKAIVVYINSPGGTVLPSAEMYRALREAQKPVVAVMGDVAASGGYYVACGADKIVAHPATITGSIGVYGQLVNAADLLDELGVEGIIVRSGEAKAVGNWFEHPTEEQLAIEQQIVDEMYALFVQAVAEGRDMDEARVRELGDGRPYTGRQALELGLVDMLGNLSDGIREAATLANIAGEPRVITYQRTPSLLESLLAAQQSTGVESLLQAWLDGWFVLPQMRYPGP